MFGEDEKRIYICKRKIEGYARWEKFVVAIGRAMESCKTLGINVDDHFREATKMIASMAKPISQLNMCRTTAAFVVC